MLKATEKKAQLRALDKRRSRQRKKTGRLVTFYSLFAAVSTLANIGSQELSIRVYQGPLDVPVSVIVGTASGLILKYILDKRFIFGFKPSSRAHDQTTFLLYSLMGVFTTFIFWGFEFLFDWLFHAKDMRYLGGVIGLVIGYVSKYHLDRRYVFKGQSP